MINKNLKRIVIILLIAAFSIACIVACGGADITGSGRSYSSENTDIDNNTEDGDNNGGDGERQLQTITILCPTTIPAIIIEFAFLLR